MPYDFLLRTYMEVPKIDKHSNGYIFRGLCKRGNTAFGTERENVLDD